MKIETIEIAGFAGALRALRLPYGKDMKSTCCCDYVFGNGVSDDSRHFSSDTFCYIKDEDAHLLSTLVKRGDEHAKVIRGINVWYELTAPIYFYREIETYRFGRERLASESTMHIECRGLSGEELQKAKAEIPMGLEQRTVDMVSYQTLRRIVSQRHNHRLPEWHQFVEWVKTLPFADELIFAGLDTTNKQ